MKKLYTLLAALVISASTFAQAPEKMSYQAVVRDAGNAIVSNQAVGMQLSILQGSTAVYVETQTPTTNANGLVSIEIGIGNVVSGDFSTIDWSAGPYFIKTETDPTGGTTYTITGTSELLSVPYALHAKTAETAESVSTFNYYYVDRDNDGYGDIWNVLYSPSPPTGYVTDNTDCNDADGAVWEPQTFYVDSDRDGFGSTTTELFCTSYTPFGYSVNATDCDDTDVSIWEPQTYYVDSDGDGFGSTTTELLCVSSAPSGYSNNATDCDDTNALLSPGAEDIPGDGIDNDCDGTTDEAPGLGDPAAGGIVFYIAPTPTDLDGDGTLDTGLVCATVDQSSGIRWFNGSYVVTGATGLTIGTGSANTDAIIAEQGATETSYAAGLARAYDGGGFDDWFLPSKDELSLMRQNVGQGNALGLGNIGNFSNSSYLSSTEATTTRAWYQNFCCSGTQSTTSKSGQLDVRAVRAF